MTTIPEDPEAKEPLQTLGVRMSHEMLEHLRQASLRVKTTPSAIVRGLVAEWLSKARR